MASYKEGLHFGNDHNYWLRTSDAWDLSRGADQGEKWAIETKKDKIIIHPARSALVIVDMQNYFLLDPYPVPGGIDLIPAQIASVRAARQAGMPVIWLNWALTRSDAANMMPSFAKTMYTHRGVPLGEPLGPSIDGKELGPALGKGSYNAELYGPLKALAEEGVAAGTDVVLGKNRLSGLWGGSSALGSYLDFNEIRTLFFAGVATDQCVWGTMKDAFHKGFDIALLTDLVGSASPSHAAETIHYSVSTEGFALTSEQLIAGLGGSPTPPPKASSSAPLAKAATAPVKTLREGAKFGPSHNFWQKTADGWDLTRGDGEGSRRLRTTHEPVVIAPKRTALIVIDMQNYFCHKAVSAQRTAGREMVPTLMKTVEAFRKAGAPVAWTNMTFSKRDLTDIPPCYYKMSHDSHDGILFGESIGKLDDGRDMGGKLLRGSWNAQLYGPLHDFAAEGIANGTDVWHNKNRFSALSGPSSNLHAWLDDNEITTLVWAGVATDQCVWSSCIDGWTKGYDLILATDLCDSFNPAHTRDTALWNSTTKGWCTTSDDLISALA